MKTHRAGAAPVNKNWLAAAHEAGMENNANTPADDSHAAEAHVRRPGDSEAMWSIEELVSYLGVPYETFRTWRRNGQGPAPEYRFGRLLRYTEEDVAGWIASGCGTEPPRREPVDANAAYGW